MFTDNFHLFHFLISDWSVSPAAHFPKKTPSHLCHQDCGCHYTHCGGGKRDFLEYKKSRWLREVRVHLFFWGWKKTSNVTFTHVRDLWRGWWLTAQLAACLMAGGPNVTSVKDHFGWLSFQEKLGQITEHADLIWLGKKNKEGKNLININLRSFWTILQSWL